MQIPSVMSSGAAAAAPSDKPRTLQEAAQAFEALLVGQMLKMVREAGEQGGLGESDSSSSSVMEMAEENLARQMSANGGLGLAKVISSQLAPRIQKLNDTVERASPPASSNGAAAAPDSSR